MKPIPPKSLHEICSEWDNACTNRHKVICEGNDVSLLAVTAPCMLKNIQEEHPSTVLDVGCGTGYLTARIKQIADFCWGIDASEKSISIAKQTYIEDGLMFAQTPLSEFKTDFKFDMCVSNMALTCDPQLSKTLKHMFEILKQNGCLLIIISHPCFWPKYWKFDNEPWFEYDKEVFIEHNFSISFAKSLGTTTFIHRPLDLYLNSIISAGFSVESIEEPYPTEDVPDEYKYEFPRFLFIKCRKS